MKNLFRLRMKKNRQLKKFTSSSLFRSKLFSIRAWCWTGSSGLPTAFSVSSRSCIGFSLANSQTRSWGKNCKKLRTNFTKNPKILTHENNRNRVEKIYIKPQRVLKKILHESYSWFMQGNFIWTGGSKTLTVLKNKIG